MLPKARAMKDLADACTRLGWEARLHHTGEVQDGLVAGEAGYMELVTGAVDAVEADVLAQPTCDSSRAEGLESANGEIAPQKLPSESPREAVQEDPILPPDSEHPEAQKSKVAGRILGAVNGKPVGMLSQEGAPEEG